jgi:cell division septum initiation protein DivIVA
MTVATMILNQIQFLHKLKDAGFTEKQAETLTEAVANDVVSVLATKQDLKQEVSLLREEMKTMEHRLYVRIGGIVAATVAFVPAFTKHFFGF